jgi:hypothetical protein
MEITAVSTTYPLPLMDYPRPPEEPAAEASSQHSDSEAQAARDVRNQADADEVRRQRIDLLA